MSVAELVQTTAKPKISATSGLLLQRKCACGGSAGMTGECEECKHKKFLGKPLQTKLRVNEPGDEYEREADRVADQVIRMPNAQVGRESAPNPIAPLVQRRVGGTSTAGISTAPPIVHDVLSSPGQQLAATTRAFFEPRFGHDFGDVRVHAGTRAAESVRSVSAQAYTVGNHVVLGAGRSVQDGAIGDRLLAHELAHVVQQQGESSATHNEIAQRQSQDTAVAHSDVKALPTQMLYRLSLPLPEFARETFTRDELEAYVNNIMSNDQIEGAWGSDNKARAYVRFARTSLVHFAMSPQLRKLLILELLNGQVTSEDQAAILSILERSRPEDHSQIFASRGVTAGDLFRKITDHEYSDRLIRYWGNWTRKLSSQLAEQHNQEVTERLERAIGDYGEAKQKNLYWAKIGPSWETKLATVGDGEYKPWHDLWAAGEYNQFAFAVASFQSALGAQEENIDGVLGPLTWARLAGLGEAMSGIEKVTWPESENTCTIAAKERLYRGYERATGTVLKIPEDKSETVAHWILHSRSEHMKDLPMQYRATGAAGLAVYLGLGEFVSESQIWEGKLQPGAPIQVWGSRENYDSMRSGKTTGEQFSGTNIVFVRYDTETNERMLVRHFGKTEWKSKSSYDVWVAANMRTPDTELPTP